MVKRKKSHEGKSVWLTVLGLAGLSALVAYMLRGKDIILFNPKGPIANEQHRLLIFTTIIMLVIAVPVLFILYYFAWKYRETNTKAEFEPDQTNSNAFVAFLWCIPIVFLIILASILIPATHKLEPQKRLNYGRDTMKIQVVALNWKWLFIYPEYNVASVNYVQFPEDTPVEFELTADEAPMNSFWIPHLGGMLYAMTGHVNYLNLLAEEPGDYQGSAAEISGNGFAGMRFTARASTQAEFADWVRETNRTAATLTAAEYETLVKPSKNNPPALYANPEPDLYNMILNKYADSHPHYGGNENIHEEAHE